MPPTGRTPSPCTRGCSRSAPPRPPSRGRLGASGAGAAGRQIRRRRERQGLQAQVGKGDARALRAAGGHDQHPDAYLRGGSRRRRARLDRRALLLISVITVGRALFDPTAGGVQGPIQRISEPLRRHPTRPRPNNGPRTEQRAGRRSRPEPVQEPRSAAAAEQAVFDMYYEMSFARPDTSYAYLSKAPGTRSVLSSSGHSRRTSTLSLT